jgi:prepilin-type N-terminal cleavage/methylation domain-containing protein
MRLRQSGKRKGFTLVEVMVASAILGIGLAAAYATLSQGFNIVSMAREQRRATQILLQTTETLRLYTWDQIHTPGFMPTQFIAPYAPDNSTNSGMNYTVGLTVSPFPTSTEQYHDNICQVLVTVDWSSHASTRHREITTFVTRYGLQNCIYY